MLYIIGIKSANHFSYCTQKNRICDDDEVDSDTIHIADAVGVIGIICIISKLPKKHCTSEDLN